MFHYVAIKLVGKDQQRRLRYQERQRIQAKCINGEAKAWTLGELSEGQLKAYASKLVK